MEEGDPAEIGMTSGRCSCKVPVRLRPTSIGRDKHVQPPDELRFQLTLKLSCFPRAPPLSSAQSCLFSYTLQSLSCASAAALHTSLLPLPAGESFTMSAAAVLSRASGRVCSRNSLAAFRAQDAVLYVFRLCLQKETRSTGLDVRRLTPQQQEDAGSCGLVQILRFQMFVHRKHRCSHSPIEHELTPESQHFPLTPSLACLLSPPPCRPETLAHGRKRRETRWHQVMSS